MSLAHLQIPLFMADVAARPTEFAETPEVAQGILMGAATLALGYFEFESASGRQLRQSPHVGLQCARDLVGIALGAAPHHYRWNALLCEDDSLTNTEASWVAFSQNAKRFSALVAAAHEQVLGALSCTHEFRADVTQRLAAYYSFVDLLRTYYKDYVLRPDEASGLSAVLAASAIADYRQGTLAEAFGVFVQFVKSKYGTFPSTTGPSKGLLPASTMIEKDTLETIGSRAHLILSNLRREYGLRPRYDWESD